MSDKDSDKTRVKPPTQSALPSDDVTRVVSPSTPPVDDKTQIPPAASRGSVPDGVGAQHKQNPSEDKTRLSPALKTPHSDTPEDLKQQKLRQQILQKQLRQQNRQKQLRQEKLAQQMIKQGKLQLPGHKPLQTADATQFNPSVFPEADKASSLSAEADRKRRAAAELSTGEHIVLKERFILERVLGSGGMGVVYKAKDLLKVEAQDRDPYVAIKVLSDEFKAHPKAFISLQRESRKSQRIAHPNIVNVFDFDRDGDTVFMTMEYLDGNSLDQLIRQYKATGLPTDDVWDIINGLTAALSHAHAENIIHSDFKPGNIFVTQKGATKVFDFGIARAVAKVEQQDESPEDKTVFDAGNLGALTPAYASLEMLDIRDDLYALGCVAYELFTGEHPYRRLPANEAEKQGLTAKRINNIKKFQWLAIKKAIAFRREDRFDTVERFTAALTPKIKSSNTLLMSIVIILLISMGGYFSFFNESADSYSELDIRNELELKIKIDYLKEDLASLVKSAAFTDPWQDGIWKNVSDLLILVKNDDPWLDQQKMLIYQLYLKEISSAVDAGKYNKAKALIQNAQRYTDDVTKLDAQQIKIASLVQDATRTREVRQKREIDEKRLSHENDRRNQQNKMSRARKVELFDVALENVNAQTKCQGRLNMRNVQTAVEKLRDLDHKRYNRLEGKIVNSLAGCIAQTGKAFPERATEAKKQALRIFKSNQVLMALKIKQRDPCDISLAGLGSRGKRALCKDKIKDAGAGPVLIVIPGNQKIRAFAIGKFEVSVRELNKFCKVSPGCRPIKGDTELPVSNITFKVAKAYLKWLSRQSRQKYRLPTKNSTRGIEKGGKLVRASIGKQNSWGLVNYVGNVQEWVYDKGRKLVAVGGSFKQSMDNCTVTTTHAHNGSADISTGLRVVRELRAGS